jgi:hypothetical protein
VRGIDIENRNQHTVWADDRHDDFRSRARITDDVPGEVVYIGDDNCALLSGSGSTDTMPKRNLEATEGPLVRADSKQLTRLDNAIEPAP